MAETSTKPYLVRALYEWCTDNGYRPFIAVVVDERTRVPREFVRNGEIVLNIAAAATNRLHIGNELLEFEARFSGVARHVSIPIDNVTAIFAQENGHGMAFEVPAGIRRDAQDEHSRHPDDSAHDDVHEAPGQASGSASAEDDEAGAARGAGRARRPEGPHAVEAAPEEPRVEEPASAGKRAGTARAPKRARRTTLRDVSSPASGETASTDAPPNAAEGRRAKSRPRKPTIAAVPRAEESSGESSDADRQGRTPDRPGDDDPGPGAPPRGRPRLTRVK